MLCTEENQRSQTALLATFYVGGTMCGLDAAGVQEVIRVDSVTSVSHAPAEVAGVMNLRGRIMTLLDLRRILGLGRTDVTRQSRVFILENRNEFIGLLVDDAGDFTENAPLDAAANLDYGCGMFEFERVDG